jgi:hypothetical protein
VAWPKGVPKDEATKRKIGAGVRRAWNDPERIVKRRLEAALLEQKAASDRDA